MQSDTLFFNAKIFTGKDTDSFAQSMTVRDGRIIALNDSPEHFDGHLVDLEGHTVIPTLCDVHTHPSWVADTVHATACVAPLVNNIEEMITALKTHPAYGKGSNAWITGWGYDEGKLAEHRTPTRHDLDRVSTSQPVIVRRSDCHSAICNTRALELAGVSRDTPDPQGGRFERDEDGNPNGVLTEFNATLAVLSLMTPVTFENQVKTLCETAEHYLSRGITTMTEMMASRELLDVYRAAVDRGFPIRCGLYLIWTGKDDPYGMPELSQEDKTGATFIAGIKLFADGSVTGRTAWVKDPYQDGSRGFSMLVLKHLDAAWQYATRNKVQISVHAMGDRAIEEVIDFFENKDAWLTDRPSVRIEHVTFLSQSQAKRMAASPMHFGITTQIIFPYAEIEAYLASLNTDTLRRIYPVRSLYPLIDAIALSSDAPASAWADPDNPFMSLMGAVTRRTWDKTEFNLDESITREEALLCYTTRAMKVLPFEGSGTLLPGKRADFAVLSDNYFTVKAEEIGHLLVLETWIGGVLMWAKH